MSRLLPLISPLIFALVAGTNPMWSQTQAPDSIPPMVLLNEAVVAPAPSIPDGHSCQPGTRRFSRLEKRVLKVWPYAAFAGLAMDSLEAELANTPSKKQRKALISDREDALKDRFEGELRRLTIREGIILIRLIDRQANQTTFGVVQELKGRLSAFMWQGLARLFGHDLKSEYDPAGEDAAIEYIIHLHGLEDAKAEAPPMARALR
ncbi:DUF4294 domain-containing protein [Flavobacteriales bacterium]|nr:DUF4294 domain-containing protein [Flavobacteriales bacterium]